MLNYDEYIENIETNIKDRVILSEACKESFLCYILNIFYIINGSKFKLKPFHKILISKLEDIVYQRNTKRNAAFCVPVGAGKSLIIEYFITWCFARTINNAFCYVSFSDRLINRLSKECKDIIENPHWQLLFKHQLKKDDRQRINFSFQEAKNRTGLTAGTTGGAITGLDAGNPNVKGFSGALIIDDPMDVADWRYEKARQEVITYYDDKLATRRRTANTPTILVMQRIHMEDLVGWIEKNESDLWDITNIPALNEDNTSFWPERYPVEELQHIKLVNNFKFMSQYQQSPITSGGSIIKGEWFKYYPINTSFNYKKIIIAADTAITVKESSDYSCFLVGGITDQNKLHILEMLHNKWEYPELKKNALELYNRWQLDKRLTSASSICIENRASGQQLIQDFRKNGLPVEAIDVTKDKLTRVEEVLDYIVAGQVLLPECPTYGNNKDLLNECESFTRDDSHSHDDIVDTLVHLINSSIAKRKLSILDVL